MKFRMQALLGAAVAVTALSGLGCVKVVSRALAIPPGEPGPVRIEMNVMVPMRDGIKLAVDVYRPDRDGRFPAILSRIPYGTDEKMYDYIGKYFARNGYVLLAQDTRGIENSEGTWYPLIYEIDDGRDTTNWIKEQPWYDGKLGMIGASYFGYTQWETALDNPDVTCMVPLFTSPNMFKMVVNGGALEYLMVDGWLEQMRAQIEDRKWDPDLSGGYFNAPMREAGRIDLEAIKKHPKDYDPMALMQYPGDLMGQAAGDFTPYYTTVSAPALLISGWFDQFEQPQLDDFVAIRAEGKGDARKSRLIVGPWTHGLPSSKMEDHKLDGVKLFLHESLKWYDYWLKGMDNGVVNEAPVKIFIMGENVWRDEQEWPLARTQYTDYFIHSDGTAAKFPGGGALSLQAPAADEPLDTYDYDPQNPMPTKGGTFQPFPGIEAGSFDQTEFLSRPDVLFYVTEPLQQGVEVTGRITVTLYASSSAKDTDFTAMLLDVHPDGKRMYIQDGAIRARYRDGYEKGVPLVPGQVYELKLDLWSTSNYFLPGHRIALEITSSNFPQYDRNTNGGGEGGPDNIMVARQNIHHSAQYPTRITLPVIPR
ncbi:MAG TPA: CocE/NonD family hydrolase [bacterium]|nr:CocE/NonD family hydrolase [bacterium]